jgi:hypothetical protein
LSFSEVTHLQYGLGQIVPAGGAEQGSGFVDVSVQLHGGFERGHAASPNI